MQADIKIKENNMTTHTVPFKDALNYWIKLGFISYKVILPNGGVDHFALISAAVSLALLQEFYLAIHYRVPIAAAAGVI